MSGPAKRLPCAVVWIGSLYDIQTAEHRYELDTDRKALALRRRLKRQGLEAHYITRREHLAMRLGEENWR